jgi:hypothetical protein
MSAEQFNNTAFGEQGQHESAPEDYGFDLSMDLIQYGPEYEQRQVAPMQSETSGGYDSVFDQRLIDTRRALMQPPPKAGDTVEGMARRNEWIYRESGTLGLMVMSAFQQPESVASYAPPMELGMAMSAASQE